MRLNNTDEPRKFKAISYVFVYEDNSLHNLKGRKKYRKGRYEGINSMVAWLVLHIRNNGKKGNSVKKIRKGFQIIILQKISRPINNHGSFVQQTKAACTDNV